MRVYGPSKQWAEIISCYPTKRQIHAQLRDGGKVQIAVFDVPPTFRWPQTGEIWSICRDPMDNVTWVLDGRIHGYRAIESNGSLHLVESEDLEIENMAAGDLRLDSDKIYESRGYRVAPVDLSTIDNGETLVWNEADQVLVPGVAPTAGGGTSELVVVNATLTTNTTVPAGYGKVPWDTEVTDSHGFWTNNRFQPTLAGWYQITTNTLVGAVATGQGTWTYIAKNSTGGNFPTTGLDVAYSGRYAATAGEAVANNISATVYMNGTTDFLEVWYWGWNPNTWTLYGTASNNPAFVSITSVGGPSGRDGNTILTGSGVPGGALGRNGDFYINTATNTLYGPKAAGSWPAGVLLVGPTGPQGLQGIQGIQGVQGLSVLSGSSDPTTQGTNGDFYINTTTWKIFGPKSGGAWPGGVNLVGPQGIQGIQGIQGVAGTNGQGVPTGGTTGQALVKVDAADYNTTWGAAGHNILDEGVARANRPNMDFQGAGVSVVDDAANSKTIVTIPGGGGGGGSALGGAQYTTTIGDGTARAFTVTHALGTRNVQVSVYQTASPYQDVTGGLEYEHASVDQVIIRTSTSLAPLTAGEYTVVVSGPGAALSSQSIDPWHNIGAVGEPVFLNSWVNYDPNLFHTAGFRKMPDGRVQLKGSIKNGTINQPAFTLPVGYRPANGLRFSGQALNNAGAFGQINVYPDGTVYIYFDINTIASLDDVSFIAEDVPVTSLPAGPPGTSGNSWTAVIGDGTSKTFTLTHGMGTRSVNVACYQTNSPYSEVEIEVERTSPNVVTVKTATGLPAPIAGQYTVVITGPGAAVSSQTIENWHLVGASGEPAFAAFWQNYPSDNPVGFRKDPLGKVQLKGLIQILTGGGTTMFTLPVGYRPQKLWRFTGASSVGPFFLQVTDTGAVMYSAVTGYPGVAANQWIDLSVIEFDTETITTLPAGPPGGQSYTQTFGDGTNRVFTVPHNLGSWNVTAIVRETNSPRAVVPAEIEYTDQNTLTIRTSAALAAPTAGQYTVVVNGPGSAITQQTLDPAHVVGAVGEPAFQNTYANYTGIPNPVQFRKDPMGRVMVKGAVQGGTNSTAIFTLPTGYRPANQQFFNVLGSSGAAGNYVYVQTDGAVVGVKTGTELHFDIEFDSTTLATTLPAGPQGVPGGTSSTSTIGDGTNRTYTVDHNLGTRNVTVQVYENTVPYADVTSSVEFERTTTNQVTLRFHVGLPAPSQNQYTVVVAAAGAAGVTDPVIVEAAKTVNSAAAGVAGYQGVFAFETETVDTHGWWNGSRFQPTRAGYYHFDLGVMFGGTASGSLYETWVVKNYTGSGTPSAANLVAMTYDYAALTNAYMNASGVAYLNGTTDYVEAIWYSGAAGGYVYGIANERTYFAVHSVSASGPQGPPGPAGNLPAKVSTLPTVGLSDGLEVYFQNAAMAAQGVRWHMVYNLTTGKWEYVGGPPLIVRVNTAQSIATATWGDLATVGPDITLPFAGDYDVELGATLYNSSANAYTWIGVGYGAGWTTTANASGSAPTNDGSGTYIISAGDTFYNWRSTLRITGAAAGALLRMRYSTRSASTTAFFQDRVLSVRPVTGV